MDSSLTASLLLLSVVFMQFVAAADQNNFIKTAEPGNYLILPCKDPDQGEIIVIEWSRTDLGPESVLLYRNDQFDPANQHPSYQDRVDLLVGEIRKGDVSLILKNPTTDISGTYECRVVKENRGEKLISTISLQVSPPPPPRPPPPPPPPEVARMLQSTAVSQETIQSGVQMLQNHYRNLRSTETFHSIFEEAKNAGINGLVQEPTLPLRRRAPRRYDDGNAPHQWDNPEEYFRSQFFEVVDLLTSELTRRFNRPTLHLLMEVEQVLLKAINKAPGSISIPQNVVDMYSGDVDVERLSIQLSMFPVVLESHSSSTDRPINLVTKISTITDMLAAQGQGTDPYIVKLTGFSVCI